MLLRTVERRNYISKGLAQQSGVEVQVAHEPAPFGQARSVPKEERLQLALVLTR